MSAEEIPDAAQAERLTEILRGAGALAEGRVGAVTAENARATFLSKVMRLRLDYEGDARNAPATLFLKIGHPERLGANWASGRQEVAFYRTVAPKVQSGVLPRCFDADWDAETNRWHILLEDLKDTHAQASPWPVPPTYPQSLDIVRSWASFHAAWWDDPRLGETVGEWSSLDTREKHARAFAEQFAPFADRLSDRLPSDRRDLYERVFAAWPRLWPRYESRRKMTIVHGDAHFWNCFLPKDAGDTIRLFDWDAWRLGLATDDLAYMIAMHWSTERRRCFEQPLLDHYHATLVDHGVQGYDREALQADYRLSALDLIMRPVWQALNDLPPLIWWNNLERIFAAVDDLGCRDLLG